MFNYFALTFIAVLCQISCASVPLDQTVTATVITSTIAAESRQSAKSRPLVVPFTGCSCWALVIDGRRLDPQFIVRSVYAATLVDCQRECEDVLFNCETIAYGKSTLRNATCDLSDWEAASLTFQPYATDTILAPTFNVYSRYGRYPNEPQDERTCNQQHLNANANHHRPTPTKLQAETLSEDGEGSLL